MGRLPGFDYRRPFFYMVTLKKLPGIGEFSRIVASDDPPGGNSYLEATPIYTAFSRIIRGFAGKWRGLAPIECFAIMPDHIHLLLKIEDTPDRLALGKYVYQIEKSLAREYWGRTGPAPATLAEERGDTGRMVAKSATPAPGATTAEARGEETGGVLKEAGPSAPNPAGPPPIFAREWHDWIVKKDGQLAAFTRYIRENGMRAWRRQRNRRYFTTVRDIDFAGRTWHAYGNAELLDMPVLEPFRCSRSWPEGGPEWSEALGRAERIGPGGAGVGTFMSACEKACGNAIFRAGGSLVALSPEGFPPRWHPTRNKEALCAEGRMLFLSLYEPQSARLDNATLYRRCHEMGDLIQGIGPDGTGPAKPGPDGTGPAKLGPDGTGPAKPGPDGTGPCNTRQDATATGVASAMNDAPLEEVVRAHVRGVWERHGRNASEAARVLGISRNTIRAKLG